MTWDMSVQVQNHQQFKRIHSNRNNDNDIVFRELHTCKYNNSNKYKWSVLYVPSLLTHYVDNSQVGTLVTPFYSLKKNKNKN